MNSVIFRTKNMNSPQIETTQTISPLSNHIKNDKGYKIELMVPGFTKEEINIQVEKNKLIIKGKKSENNTESTSKYLRTGFKVADFETTYTLSDKIDSENITASNNEGILAISLPYKAEILPVIKKIEVQ
jgi:HSP20 family protein